MGSYIARRLLLTLPVLIGILFITFFLTHLSGDPTDLLLPQNATDEARAAFRAANGLDQPLWVQFVDFARKAVTGDFGQSLRFQQPAMALVLERLPATAELAAATMLLAILIGIPAGVVAAVYRNTNVDVSIRGIMLLGQAVPSFYLGVVAIIVFAVGLRWFPTGGSGTLAHLVLPATTLAFNLVALIARVTRSSMLDVLNQDYVRTARAKGAGKVRVVAVHALRNALIPVVTTIGLQIGTLFAGAILTETIFAWPGVGKWLVEAIHRRDYAAVQGGILCTATIIIAVNLIVDVLYGVINPRIRHA
jgi:peptide/nickel transport system permease protein